MTRRNQPYIPLYVQDFMTDEKLNECSAESTGVYIRLMCLMHKSKEYGTILLKQKDKQDPQQNVSSITDFANKLVKHMPYDTVTIERSLRELIDEEVIYIDGDKLCQKRMINDDKLSNLRASAGSKGGKKRIEKSDFAKGFANDFAQANSEAKYQANSENEIEIEIENEIDINNKKSNIKDQKNIIEERFNLFWSEYPRKVGKGQAKKIWFKISPNKELFEKIISALKIVKNCEQWKVGGGQFIPHPATWLNQERWDDEYDSDVTNVPDNKASPPKTRGTLLG